MVCFIILHYMAKNETILCVDSIRNNVKGEKKIIIVDNDSPNKTFNDLKQKYQEIDEVDVIKTEKNLGFANGNNFGYKYAINTYNPDFVVVMNNDMEINQETFIDLIKSSYEEYSYYIMGPDIYSTKKNYHQNPQVRKAQSYSDLLKAYKKLRFKYTFRFLIPLKWKIKEIFKKEKENRSKIYENRKFITDVVENPMLHGACYIFSPLFIKKYPDKCFYDKTFMYLEAEILYYLSKKNNEKMIYYPNIKILHHEDAATDLTYKKKYKKSIFSVKCLTQSVKAFIELMEINGDINE